MFYNRNGIGLKLVEEWRKEGRNMELDIIERERDLKRQEEGNKIEKARYNKIYKVLDKGGSVPEYLSKENVTKGIYGNARKILVNLRCGNLELDNKYWLEEEKRLCVFCNKGRDNLKHYVDNYVVIKDWFVGLGDSTKEKLRKLRDDKLKEGKAKILTKLWRERNSKLSQKTRKTVLKNNTDVI